MGGMRSALEEYRAIELRCLSAGELEDDVTELKAVMAGLEVECSRRIAELDRRQSFERDGHLSMAAWVDARFHTGWSAAAKEVLTARALEGMPATRAALAEGELCGPAVATLVSAKEANAAEFSRAEETLLDAARNLPARALRRTVEHWKAAVAPDAAARDDAERFERRGLRVSAQPDGMVRVDANLDPEGGQTLGTAVGAVMDVWAHSRSGDPRSPSQCRADALVEICRQWLDRSDRPTVSGERPHVTVTVDVEALEKRAGRRCELDDVGRVPSETARRLACDASITRVITRGPSEPLEIGRKTPVISAALRRAVAVRDRGCRFPGCDRPMSWCDAHHVVHWADGGRTDLSNLILLCRRHHRLIRGGFRMEMTTGSPVFRRPDGMLLGDRAPP
jgi:hypothetical protein